MSVRGFERVAVVYTLAILVLVRRGGVSDERARHAPSRGLLRPHVAHRRAERGGDFERGELIDRVNTLLAQAAHEGLEEARSRR
jgi:hypothetical protein